MYAGNVQASHLYAAVYASNLNASDVYACHLHASDVYASNI